MDITKIANQVPKKVYDLLANAIQTFDINDNLKLSHFLSQCSYESENFTVTIENLNYRAENLIKTFPSHFDSSTVNNYARQPEKIANRAYANRMGNGNEQSGDGWKYRGRGFIQLTGKVNYQSFANYIKVPQIINNPDLVASIYSLDSAGFYFAQNNIFSIAEKGSGTDIITNITKVINGGTNGLEERINLFNKFYSLLNS